VHENINERKEMKIQSINLYNPYNYSKNNIKNNASTPQNLQNNKNLPSISYVPFFGASKKHNPVIQGILDDKNISKETKDVMNNWLNIKHFEAAAMGVNREEMLELLNTGKFLFPFYEDLFKGKYRTIFMDSKIEKPILDIPSIAKYNLKHPDKPINLYENMTTNPLFGLLLMIMHKTRQRRIEKTINLSYTANGIRQSSFIRYFNEPEIDFPNKTPKISSKRLNEIKDAPIPKNMREFLKSKYMNKDLKEILWELSEIPFFNAAAKNLSMEDLVDILADINFTKPFSMEVLHGNVTIRNTSTKTEKPIIDLAEIAIHNELNPKNQRHLFEEFCCNKLYSKIMEQLLTTFYDGKKLPNYLMCMDKDGGMMSQVNLDDIGHDVTPDMVRHFFNKNKTAKLVPYAIFIQNDLNEIIEETEMKIASQIKEKRESQKVQQENFKLKYASTPDSIKDFLQTPGINSKYKELAYNLTEEPYFNMTLQNADIDSIKNIIKLKYKYPTIFEKFFNGKVQLLDSIHDFQPNPIINLKSMHERKIGLHEMFNEGLFDYDLCQELGTFNKVYPNKISSVKYQLLVNGSVECIITLKDDNQGRIRRIKNIPDSIRQYLCCLKDEQFTLTIDD